MRRHFSITQRYLLCAGQSSLYNGERRSKTDVVFQALGDVDELNSVIGVARQFIEIPTETQNDIATLVSFCYTLLCQE